MAKSTNALGFRCQPLVTVELQLPGDLFLSLCSLDRIQNQFDELIFCGLVIDNAIVIQISDDRQVQETLNGFDVYPAPKTAAARGLNRTAAAHGTALAPLIQPHALRCKTADNPLISICQSVVGSLPETDRLRLELTRTCQ